MLAGLGARVIDADQVAREVVQPGEPALAEVVREFGPEMLRADGTLDRAALAAAVFESREARQAVNGIMHPRIGAVVRQQVRAWDWAVTGPEIIVVEAAVLYEAGWEALVDRVVGVEAKQSLRVARLIERDGLDQPRAVARVRVQVSAAALRARADHLVRTDVSLEATRAQVRDLWACLLAAAGEKLARHGVVPQ